MDLPRHNVADTRKTFYFKYLTAVSKLGWSIVYISDDEPHEAKFETAVAVSTIVRNVGED